MAVTLLALSLSISYDLWAGFVDAREMRVRSLRTIAALTATQLEAAIAFQDKAEVENSLQMLRSVPSIQYAEVRSTDQTLTIDYNPSEEQSGYYSSVLGKLQNGEEQVGFEHLVLKKDIIFDGKRLGSLAIYFSLSEIFHQLKQVMLERLLVLFLCLLICYFAAQYLQKSLTAPLSYLIDSMDDIAEKQDYGKRLEVNGVDEFSVLVRQFNSMLTEIEKRDRNLEHKVQLRTEELRDALRVSESARDAKSQFLANTSHELRTPLNGIIGMIGLLKEQELTEEQSELLGLLSNSTDTLLKVINDVLDLSKIERGAIELEQHEFTLKELINSITSLICFQAQEKGLSCVVNCIPDERTKIIGDNHRLKQVALNLLGNSIKFTNGGGAVMLTLWLDEINENLSRLHISVSDTGIGIAKHKLQTIFHPFTQADGSTTRKYGGTGLGLTISRQLVELMGGQIQARSKEGVGSCFQFYVTVGCKQEKVVEGSADQGGHRCEASNEPGTLKILVAEDNTVNQRLAKRLLESEQHQVTIAQNGKEAAEMLQAQDFDLVLMDIQMPVMDGLEATRLIRQLNGEKGKIPILGVSAHAFVEDRERSKATGMNGYLTKPYKKADLLSSIHEVMQAD